MFHLHCWLGPWLMADQGGDFRSFQSANIGEKTLSVDSNMPGTDGENEFLGNHETTKALEFDLIAPGGFP